MLKEDSQLASSHLEIYESLFQSAIVASKNFIKFFFPVFCIDVP